MDTVKVYIGTEQRLRDGRVNDLTRPVEFVGEERASLSTFGAGRDGNPTDTRGVTETLYETDDGRLVVYTEDWSHWAGEPNTYTLQEVTEEDLCANGRFEDLGREAGFVGPLTLDEALA